jgi:hypothetical protein
MAETAASAWRLVQLGALIRAVERIQLDLITILGPDASADITADATIDLTSEELRRVGDRVELAYELTEAVRALAAQLGDGDLHVTFDDVREGAAAELGDGILDPRRALLAASLLDVHTGWAALARALRESEAVRTWDEVTVAQVLMQFRDIDRMLPERLTREAQLAPEAVLARCSELEFTRLADVLERYGDSLRRR